MSQGKNIPVLKSVEKCAALFGVTPQEYVDNYMAKMNNPEVFIMQYFLIKITKNIPKTIPKNLNSKI